MTDTRDTCFQEAIYIAIPHQHMALHSISSLSEPLHTFPARPHLYISCISLQVVSYSYGSFFSAGVREFACSGRYSIAGPGVETGQSHIYILSCPGDAFVRCSFMHVKTNLSIILETTPRSERPKDFFLSRNERIFLQAPHLHQLCQNRPHRTNCPP